MKITVTSVVMTVNWFTVFRYYPYPLFSTATVTNPLRLTVVLNCSGTGNST